MKRLKIINRIFKIVFTFIFLTAMSVMSGCAKDNLNAPCPNFGASCQKSPVNGWDNH